VDCLLKITSGNRLDDIANCASILRSPGRPWNSTGNHGYGGSIISENLYVCTCILPSAIVEQHGINRYFTYDLRYLTSVESSDDVKLIRETRQFHC
jgi:hypothetical protein